MVLQPRYCLNNTGLGSSAFARHYLRNHFYFLLLWVLRCFSSPRSPPITGWQAFNLPGCPIRKSEDQRLFASPPSLSQLITSFIASESQGIHRLPLLTFLFPVTSLWIGLIYLQLALVTLFYVVHHVKDLVNWKLKIINWKLIQLIFTNFAIFWWRITDSNRWPSACKADALASWANPPIIQDKISICW